MSDLLIELGCEELPAEWSQALANALASGLHAALSSAELVDEAQQPASYATPRRLAVHWREVRERQADRDVERRGPAVKAAWQDGDVGGTPSKALAGFLKSAGATVDQLITIETPKGAWVAVRQVQAGRSLDQVLAEALADVIDKLPMPRRMRWGGEAHEFLRPVLWLLALHEDRVLDVGALGLVADRMTRGHRTHAPGPHRVGRAADYLSVLESAYVLADVEARRARIDEQVKQLAAEAGGTAVSDAALLDEVTSLVEWPVALAGTFEERFLEIPKEALIQTMQENQRYFALLDDHGELMPGFITVANLESQNPAVVVDGNERVIRPRFEDTMFFWKQDAGKTLASRRPNLSKVLFEEALGSVGDKADRMGELCELLAPQLGAAVADARRAAELAKCDLVSEIVKELAKMQGIAGRYYALRDGESPAVAAAVEEHYWPKRAGAVLPSNPVARTVALADRLDTLVGIFGIGRKPTGAKDPFALRRAAIAMVRIAIEAELTLDMDALIAETAAIYARRGVALGSLDTDDISQFVRERLRVHLVTEEQLPGDVVEAVLALSIPLDPFDVYRRCRATAAFRDESAALSLSAAGKRIDNLLSKSAGDQRVDGAVSTELLREPAEKDLHAAIASMQTLVAAAMAEGDYTAALRAVATLAAPVDRFFDDVMVMAEDEAVRGNRLALLQSLSALANGVAKLAHLAPIDGASQ